MEEPAQVEPACSQLQPEGSHFRVVKTQRWKLSTEFCHCAAGGGGGVAVSWSPLLLALPLLLLSLDCSLTVCLLPLGICSFWLLRLSLRVPGWGPG